MPKQNGVGTVTKGGRTWRTVNFGKSDYHSVWPCPTSLRLHLFGFNFPLDQFAFYRYYSIFSTNIPTQQNQIKYSQVNVSQLIQQSSQVPGGRNSTSFSFIPIHYKVCCILHPPPQHHQQCVLLQLYHTIIPIVERGTLLLFAHKALTLRNRRVLFLRKRMTSNSPRLPGGGKLKLLWKGTDLKSLSDKHARAYFLVLIYLLVTVGLYEGYIVWVDWPNTALRVLYCSMLCWRWRSTHFLLDVLSWSYKNSCFCIIICLK